MSIARHKKPGGFEKLVNSLEITAPDKREKIMEALSVEDPVFMDRVKQSILTFEELKAVPTELLMEVIYKLGNMQYLALALYKVTDQELVDKFIKCIPPKQMVQYKEQVEALDKVTTGQRQGAQFKIVEAARAVQADRGIKIKPYLTE